MLRASPLALALAVPVLFVATEARAQSKAAAQAAFDDAKALEKANKWDEACPKLEESQRLDPQTGTKYNLADCYEHVNKFASAWALFVEVADAMQAAGKAVYEKDARDRADKLKPRLTRLQLKVNAPDTPGLEIKRDNVVIGKPEYSAAVPVDIGKHTIAASAPSRTTWSSDVDVQGEGRTIVFEVPELQKAQGTDTGNKPPDDHVVTPPPPPPPPPGAEQPSSGLGTQRILAIGAGALGVIAVGVGTVFGLQSKSKHDDAQPHCQGNLCDPTGGQLRDDAISAGNVSTYTFIAGGVLLGGAAALWFTAPKNDAAPTTGSVRAVPVATPGGAGFVVRGAF